MSFDLLSLPSVVLDIIFDYLPVWKIRQLACMCHELNNLKNRSCNRRRHLRLFGGSVYSKHYCYDQTELYNIDHDFDLNIRFEGETSDIDLIRSDPYSFVTLSPDWYVRNAQQIDQLVRWFPLIRNLTLILANKWPQDCQARLFGLWPELNSLKIINISKYGLDWPQVGPQLNALTQLEHLVINYTDESREVFTAKNHIIRLLETGRLKTFASTDYIFVDKKTVTIDNRGVEIMDRSVWNSPEREVAVKQLESFGVSYINLLPGSNFTNLRMLQKLKQVQIYYCTPKRLQNWNFKDWTALQSLSLNFDDNKQSIRSIFAHLGALPNLDHLYIDYQYGNKLKIPSERACKSWPKLPSVRRFQLRARIDPCQLSFLSHSVPNAFDISLKLNVGGNINTSNCNGRKYLKRFKNFPLLCSQCSSQIERAADKFGANIAAHLWFYNRNQHELVPKVKLFTFENDGKTRPSSNYSLID